ncbi:hypothetical protein [Streptomyces sp. KL116D]|uniref:hypothetical protein n=1 Tax=Streptomyces sp. KL116D TaxID=3045152 RepID=UPI00355732D2
MTEDQESSEKPEKREPVDLSRFYASAFKPLTELYTNGTSASSFPTLLRCG